MQMCLLHTVIPELPHGHRPARKFRRIQLFICSCVPLTAHIIRVIEQMVVLPIMPKGHKLVVLISLPQASLAVAKRIPINIPPQEADTVSLNGPSRNSIRRREEISNDNIKVDNIVEGVF